MASLQEELAAAKLREAEANLALKDLKTKVAELGNMWQRHIAKNKNGDDANNQPGDHEASDPADPDAPASNKPENPAVAAAVAANNGTIAAPSTPKKLLGSLLEATGSAAAASAAKAEAARLEEELMTARMAEVAAQAEVKDQRLRIMELETHVRRRIDLYSYSLSFRCSIK